MMRALQPLFVLLVFVACAPKEKRLPLASGAQGEVLVVMEKGYWESGPGALVRSIFEKPIPTLPQRESRFKLVQIAPKDFGSLLRSHHSVLYAAIGQDGDTASTDFMPDRFALGQLVLQVGGGDGAAWERAFANEADAAIRRFEEHQFDRIRKQIVKERDATLVASVEKAHDIIMDIPGGYRIVEQDSTFTWLQRDRMVSGSGLEHNVIEGLLIHQEPYRSDTIFSILNLVNLRDSVTKAHVDGPAPNSYMIVQRQFETLDLMPQGSVTELDGHYAFIMHGLFGMEGAKMGGPFVSITTVCEPQVRMITVEGFVYAPQFNKREYVRELEAIVRSARFGPKCIALTTKG